MLQTTGRYVIVPQEDCVWKYVLQRFEAGSDVNVATIIANKKIKNAIEFDCLKQVLNASHLPGVHNGNIVLNPDCHLGYGVPIGSVIRTKDIIIPGSVGYDIKCSMSLLQLDLPASEIQDKKLRRALIQEISQAVPTGMGKSRSKKSIGSDAAAWIPNGFDADFCDYFEIPRMWQKRCEQRRHIGFMDGLKERLDYIMAGDQRAAGKLMQLGTYGAGNHFGECNIVHIRDEYKDVAEHWGLKDGCVSFLSHCGSRGFGHMLATHHFKKLQKHFERWGMELKDKELVYIPVGHDVPEFVEYYTDIALAGNFATLNHMLINKLVLEAFKKIIPGVNGDLIYHISHNFVDEEYDGKDKWYVHRKGATRAFPADHHALKNTPYYTTGHPILLPGDPIRGSAVMVAKPGAEKSFYSVNHGAGRTMSRTKAKKTLNQEEVDATFDEHDVLSNCRKYPLDESHGAYKDFKDVIDSVTGAGLADVVADLKAKFVIKSQD